MRTKTCEVWITRDNHAEADAEMWLKSHEPTLNNRYWFDNSTQNPGPLRCFCYRRFVQLTGIVIGQGKKRRVQFRMKILDD